jgi:hypothetical protein
MGATAVGFVEVSGPYGLEFGADMQSGQRGVYVGLTVTRVRKDSNNRIWCRRAPTALDAGIVMRSHREGVECVGREI